MQLSKSISRSLSRSIARGISGGASLYRAFLTAQGDGTGIATLRLESSEDTVIMIEGSGRFYTDAAGTLNESTEWNLTAGALRTIYIRQPSDSSNLVFVRPDLIIGIGSIGVYGWESYATAPLFSINISKLLFLQILRINDYTTITGALPVNLTYLYLRGDNINWTYTGALPVNLTILYLYGDNINWTYTGALPVNLTYLYLRGDNINWTYTGALPVNLTTLYLYGDNINWTYTTIEGTATINIFDLIKFRTEKLTSAEMVTLLTSMTNKVGGFPSTVTINDYADYTNPPQSVIDAVALLRSTKSITTVNLGA